MQVKPMHLKTYRFLDTVYCGVIIWV